MEEKIQKPKEAICLISYLHPLNVEEICLQLYGTDRNSRVPKWIKELLKEGWIKKIENFEDRRYSYYQSTPKALVESIIKDYKKYNIEITPKEKKQLNKLITSEEFIHNIFIPCFEFIDTIHRENPYHFPYFLSKKYLDFGIVKIRLSFYLIVSSYIYNHSAPKITDRYKELVEVNDLYKCFDNSFSLFYKLISMLDPLMNFMINFFIKSLLDTIRMIDMEKERDSINDKTIEAVHKIMNKTFLQNHHELFENPNHP